MRSRPRWTFELWTAASVCCACSGSTISTVRESGGAPGNGGAAAADGGGAPAGSGGNEGGAGGVAGSGGAGGASASGGAGAGSGGQAGRPTAACDLLAQTGCASGEKCTWKYASGEDFIVCAPNGT